MDQQTFDWNKRPPATATAPAQVVEQEQEDEDSFAEGVEVFAGQLTVTVLSASVQDPRFAQNNIDPYRISLILCLDGLCNGWSDLLSREVIS